MNCVFSVVISCASCICQSRCILPSEFAWFDFKFTNYDISVSWSCSSINYPSHWNKGNKHNFSSSRRGNCLHKSMDIPNKVISRVAQKLLLIAWYIIFSTLFLYKTLHQILQQHAITKTQVSKLHNTPIKSNILDTRTNTHTKHTYIFHYNILIFWLSWLRYQGRCQIFGINLWTDWRVPRTRKWAWAFFTLSGQQSTLFPWQQGKRAGRTPCAAVIMVAIRNTRRKTLVKFLAMWKKDVSKSDHLFSGLIFCFSS